jgi:hypothetical protein
MLETFFLPPAGSHRTYDSIYLRMQILSSTAFLRSIPFYGAVFCALAYIPWMSQIFIIVPLRIIAGWQYRDICAIGGSAARVAPIPSIYGTTGAGAQSP